MTKPSSGHVGCRYVSLHYRTLRDGPTCDDGRRDLSGSFPPLIAEQFQQNDNSLELFMLFLQTRRK